MIKSDEKDLIKELMKTNGRAGCLYSFIKTKRHVRILEKWARKGFWNYGTSIVSGWVELDHPSYAALNMNIVQIIEEEFK
jgi:hypothetical protein